MPLPAANTAWPPAEWNDITPVLEEWDAWYTGNPSRLRDLYRGNTIGATVRSTYQSQGLRGVLRRMWWGRQIGQTQDRPDMLHVPIATDLATASADLLYSEPPLIASSHEGTTKRLDEYVNDGLIGTLATGAEVGAALGGRYHRITWDETLTERPFLTTVDADHAWPEFRWGQLQAVTLCQDLNTPTTGTVYRHIERHELDTNGHGFVFHALYRGAPTNIGQLVPLPDHPDTAHLAHLVDETGALKAGRTPGLCVVYIPNIAPQREWRSHPKARHLGRSDYTAAIISLMDGLDEAYSSLWRDIRLAKARLIVPKEWLRTSGPGQGAVFDADREIYESLNIPDAEEGAARAELIQPLIRVDDHLRACDDAVGKIVRSAGYALATLGDGHDGGIMTATEVRARERRSYTTRGRKIRHEQPGVLAAVRKMLTIDTEVFETKNLDPDDLSVDFDAGVQEAPIVVAQTIQAMDAARAVSVDTKVRALHRDWDKTQIEAEVARIYEEQGIGPIGSPDEVPGF